MGDWLSLTPILRHMRDLGRNPLVIARDSPHTREFGTLYRGLAEIQWEPASAPTPPTLQSDSDSCFSRRILEGHGVYHVSAIPHVEVSSEEREWATAFLAWFGPKLTAFCPTIGSARDTLPEDHIANYRRMPRKLAAELVKRLLDSGRKPVWFGTKDTQQHIYRNRFEIEGVISVPDLSVRQLAACYSVIGEYVGTDTGDHHLMLSVGGRCETWVPTSRWFYDHKKFLYDSKAWLAEEPRETYRVFEQSEPQSFS